MIEEVLQYFFLHYYVASKSGFACQGGGLHVSEYVYYQALAQIEWQSTGHFIFTKVLCFLFLFA